MNGVCLKICQLFGTFKEFDAEKNSFDKFTAF